MLYIIINVENGRPHKNKNKSSIIIVIEHTNNPILTRCCCDVHQLDHRAHGQLRQPHVRGLCRLDSLQERHMG